MFQTTNQMPSDNHTYALPKKNSHLVSSGIFLAISPAIDVVCFVGKRGKLIISKHRTSVEFDGKDL